MGESDLEKLEELFELKEQSALSTKEEQTWKHARLIVSDARDGMDLDESLERARKDAEVSNRT